MPFICCSITDVTVFCTVSADAPAYMALTAMDGGATVGYCATGRCVTARMPPSMMSRESTQAKIGRSMKNFGMAMSG